MIIYRQNTSTGSISITKDVIGRIIAEAVKTFDGKVLISNQKGNVPGFPHKIKGADLINSMDIAMGDKGLDIRFYVAIHFGMSIGMITDTLIDETYAKIKEFTGLEPNSVAVVITGVISKQQMSRRNIEVRK